MAFTQYAADCPEHSSCTVIVAIANGRAVWRSHLTDAVPPETRLNLDYPDGEDRRGPTAKPMRWNLADDDALPHLGWTDEERRRVAYHAAARGLDTIAALAARAKVTPAELRAEAQAKGWDRDLPAGAQKP